jgi:hypothetical protein
LLLFGRFQGFQPTRDLFPQAVSDEQTAIQKWLNQMVWDIYICVCVCMCAGVLYL